MAKNNESEVTMDSYEAICNEIREKIPARYQWQWDDRFGTALVAIEKSDGDGILAALTGAFADKWDSKTIAKASNPVRQLVKKVFAINPGQLIFSAEGDSRSMLVGAWWPWGNGASISLRIGLFPAEDQAKNDLTRWFSIKP